EAGFAEGLIGDWLIVVLDRRTDTLVVARDPLGARPWYQAGSGRRQAGSSDIASLVSLPWVDRTVNEPVAIQYLADHSRSEGETIYRGVGTLRPGSTWQFAGGRTCLRTHHRWDIKPERSLSWADGIERCRTLLDGAVHRRLRVSGPPTSQLSGGLDS